MSTNERESTQTIGPLRGHEASAGACETPLSRQLGLTDCILLVVGNMVGTGIFLTTGSVAGVLRSPCLVLVAWLLGGLFAVAGALTYAELGACFPRSGGHYVFMREAYGPFWGFLDGWLSFVVSFPCSLAFMAMGLSEYAGFFCPALTADHAVARFSLAGAAITIHGGHLTALAAITALTILNCLGLHAGRNVQNALTVLKIGCLVFLPALIFASGKGNWSHFALPADIFGGGVFPAMAGALIGVTFAYSGWDASTYMAAEVRRPQQSVPRSLTVGTMFVTALYLVFNLALLYQVPTSRISVTENVTQEAAGGVLGHASAGITSGIVLVSILGAINATIMIGPRVYYAMAADGLFFRRLSRVHPRFKVPARAIIAQGVWTCIIIVTGTFVGLLTYTVFALLVLSTLTAAAVYVLRVRRPEIARPYRVWGYPVVPAIYCVGSLSILANMLIQNPRQSVAGLVAMGLAVPVYRYWRSRWMPGT